MTNLVRVRLQCERAIIHDQLLSMPEKEFLELSRMLDGCAEEQRQSLDRLEVMLRGSVEAPDNETLSVASFYIAERPGQTAR